jgi:hypothetical protein
MTPPQQGEQTMKVINLNHFRRDRREEQIENLARSIVGDFQHAITDAFLLPCGSPVGLLSAQRILCRFWEFADENDPKVRDVRAQRHEVAVLEDEERVLSQELFLARRRLALLECPFAERDIIEHQTGFRGWVAAVDWAREGFLVQVGRLSELGRPIKGDNRIHLWGPPDVLGWRKVGEVSPARAAAAGWLDRSE